MSVIKSKRGESPMQFIETARKLEAHTFSVVTKAPKRSPLQAHGSCYHGS